MEWRTIPGFEDYEISNHGDIVRKSDGKYPSIYLSENRWRVRLGNCKYCRYRLLALAFLPNPDNLPTVDHINIDSTDDSLENLRWASQSDQNRNRKPHSNTGHKHISKIRNSFRVNIGDIGYQKRFPTLDAAIAARDAVLLQ
jgi:hypothetical protein